MALGGFTEFVGGFTVATALAGAWALFQFFSLRTIRKAKLERQLLERNLKERGILTIDLGCEVFEVDGCQLLHLRVILRNVGNGVEVIDWAKARLLATRYKRSKEIWHASGDEVLQACPAPSIASLFTRLAPGSSTGTSFLVPIPCAGIYHIQISVSASRTVETEMHEDLASHLHKANLTGDVVWEEARFVVVREATPNNALQATREDARA